MKSIARCFIGLCVLLLAACMPIQAPATQPVAEEHNHGTREDLGTVDFAVSCTAET